MATSGPDEAGISVAELDQLQLSLRSVLSTEPHALDPTVLALSKSEAQVTLDKVWKVRLLVRYAAYIGSPWLIILHSSWTRTLQ